MLLSVLIHNMSLQVGFFYYMYFYVFINVEFNYEIIVTGSSDGNARLWNVNSGSIERVYSGHQKAITALVFRDEII